MQGVHGRALLCGHGGTQGARLPGAGGLKPAAGPCCCCSRHCHKPVGCPVQLDSRQLVAASQGALQSIRSTCCVLPFPPAGCRHLTCVLYRGRRHGDQGLLTRAHCAPIPARPQRSEPECTGGCVGAGAPGRAVPLRSFALLLYKCSAPSICSAPPLLSCPVAGSAGH